VIFNEEMVGGREMVTTDEEWVLQEVEERDQVVKIARLTRRQSAATDKARTLDKGVSVLLREAVEHRRVGVNLAVMRRLRVQHLLQFSFNQWLLQRLD